MLMELFADEISQESWLVLFCYISPHHRSQTDSLSDWLTVWLSLLSFPVSGWQTTEAVSLTLRRRRIRPAFPGRLSSPGQSWSTTLHTTQLSADSDVTTWCFLLTHSLITDSGHFMADLLSKLFGFMRSIINTDQTKNSQHFFHPHQFDA